MSADDDFDEADAPAGRAPVMRRSRLVWVWILGGLLALVILLNVWSNLWTDKLWFDSVGYSSVFRTELTTKVLLFLLGGSTWARGKICFLMAKSAIRLPGGA